MRLAGAPHKQIYDQGGSPQADLRPGKLPTDFCMEPKKKPPRTTTRVPNRNPLQTQGLPTSRITTREAPHKQSYDQGGSPQAELRPGSLPTSRITTRELLAGWLAELAGWLAGRLGGWLAGLLRPRKAQRGPERHRGSVDRTSSSGAWLGAPNKQIYDQGGSPKADLRPGRLPTSNLVRPPVQGSPSKRAEAGRLPTSRFAPLVPPWCSPGAPHKQNSDECLVRPMC